MSEPSEAHTLVVNAFRHHCFFIDISGGNGQGRLWEQAVRPFAGVFGFDSCFGTRRPANSHVTVRIASPDVCDNLEWRVEDQAGIAFFIDPDGQRLTSLPYAATRQMFTAWLFNRL